MKERRKARELALQVLYACEMSGEDCSESLIDYLAGDRAGDTAVIRYGRSLAKRTLSAIVDIDDSLSRSASNWDVKRMAAVDRNILRMAVAELLFFPDVPYKVVIDEAVEIAKKYGTPESGKFVNGVIDAVYRRDLAKR